MPRFSSQSRCRRAVASLTPRIAAWSADWLSRSLNTPTACSRSSGMMPLYIPMHPSSKIPMMACAPRRSRPSSAPRVAAIWRSPPHFSGSNARTWLRSWSMRPSVSHCASARRANSSSNASLQIVL